MGISGGSRPAWVNGVEFSSLGVGLSWWLVSLGCWAPSGFACGGSALPVFCSPGFQCLRGFISLGFISLGG